MVAPGIDQFEGHWWLVYTKPRNEKALAGTLEAFSIRYFLPLARVQRRYNGVTRNLQVPLFPGYLFLCGGIEDRYATMDTRRVVNIIEVKDQARLREDLRQVHRATTGPEPVDMYRSAVAIPENHNVGPRLLRQWAVAHRRRRYRCDCRSSHS